MKFHTVLTIAWMIFIVLTVSAVNAQYHPPEEIAGGNFSNNVFEFPNNLIVNQTLIVRNGDLDLNNNALANVDWSTTTTTSMDADTLDSMDSTDFVAAAGDTMTGDLTIASGSYLYLEGGYHSITNNDGYGNFNIRNNNDGVVYSATGKAASFEFSDSTTNTAANLILYTYQSGSTGATFGTGQIFEFFSDGTGMEIDNNEVWHEGNDGASSTLNAGLLDDQEGSYYLDNTDYCASGTCSGDLIISGNNVQSNNNNDLMINDYNVNGDNAMDICLFGDCTSAQANAYYSKLKLFGGSAQTRDLQLWQQDSEYAHIGSSYSSNRLYIDSSFAQTHINSANTYVAGSLDITGTLTTTAVNIDDSTAAKLDIQTTTGQAGIDIRSDNGDDAYIHFSGDSSSDYDARIYHDGATDALEFNSTAGRFYFSSHEFNSAQFQISSGTGGRVYIDTGTIGDGSVLSMYDASNNAGVSLNSEGTNYFGYAINTEGNLQLDETQVVIARPNTTGGWARGIAYYAVDTYSGTELAGMGMLGTGTTLNRYYFGFGDDPWTDSDGMFFTNTGDLGLGINGPSSRLHVYENSASDYAARFVNTGNNVNRYGIRIDAGTYDGSGTSTFIGFIDGDASNQVGSITGSGGTLTLNPFTGAHVGYIENYNDNYTYGELLCIENVIKNEETPKQVIYNVTKCDTNYSISVLGVFAGKHYDEINPNSSLFLVNSLGDGHILVTKEGGNIAIGNYLTSSNKEGLAMKQDDGLLHEYTIAKATEAVNWEEEDEDVKLISCTYHGA